MHIFSQFASTFLPFLVSLLKSLDEEALKPLAPYSGKIVGFDIEGLSPLFFELKTDGIESVHASIESADVLLTGPLLAFMQTFVTQQFVRDQIHIRGDLECAKALFDTLERSEPDIEGAWANLIGGNAAYLLCESIRRTRAFALDVAKARQDDFSRFFQDEMPLLPTATEVNAFCEAVDTLRLDVDRLEARYRLLQDSLERGNV